MHARQRFATRRLTHLGAARLASASDICREALELNASSNGTKLRCSAAAQGALRSAPMTAIGFSLPTMLNIIIGINIISISTQIQVR